MIKFDGSDIKNYTVANYNALVLYNAINVILNLNDFTITNVLEYTKSILTTHFKDIDKEKLEQSIADIAEYDKELNVIVYVSEIREHLKGNKQFIENKHTAFSRRIVSPYSSNRLTYFSNIEKKQRIFYI